MDDTNRLRRLSGLDDPSHDEDERFMASIAREKNIEKFIRHAFDKIGLEINYNNYSVNYDDESREAVVALEDNEYDLKHLNRLYETGLSDAFKVVHRSETLDIEFIVAEGLDTATLA